MVRRSERREAGMKQSGILLLTVFTTSYIKAQNKTKTNLYEETKGTSKREWGIGGRICWHHRIKPIPTWHFEELHA